MASGLEGSVITCFQFNSSESSEVVWQSDGSISTNKKLRSGDHDEHTRFDELSRTSQELFKMITIELEGCLFEKVEGKEFLVVQQVQMGQYRPI